MASTTQPILNRLEDSGAIPDIPATTNTSMSVDDDLDSPQEQPRFLDKGKQKEVVPATTSTISSESQGDLQSPIAHTLQAEINEMRRQLTEATTQLRDTYASDSEPEGAAEASSRVDFSHGRPVTPPNTTSQTLPSSGRASATTSPTSAVPAPSRPSYNLSQAATRSSTPSPFSPAVTIHQGVRRPRGCTTPLANCIVMDASTPSGSTDHAIVTTPGRLSTPPAFSPGRASRSDVRPTFTDRLSWNVSSGLQSGHSSTGAPLSLYRNAGYQNNVTAPSVIPPAHQPYIPLTPAHAHVTPAPDIGQRAPGSSTNPFPHASHTFTNVHQSYSQHDSRAHVPHNPGTMPTFYPTNPPPQASVPLPQGFNLEATLLQISSDLRHLHGEVADIRGSIDQSSQHGQHPRRRQVKGTQDERPRTVQRNLMMNTVRMHFNNLIGIKSDKQITQVATQVIVDQELKRQCEDGLLEEIPLSPLKIDLDAPRCRWNVILSRMFAERMPKPENCSWSLDEISEHFLQRVETLSRTLRENLPISADEDPATCTARVKEREDAVMKAKRSRRRQATRAKTRADIAMAGSQGGRNAPWTSLLKLVQVLKIDGHSSDETDQENGGLLVHTPGWRHPYVSKLLRFIDSNRNTKNEYGNEIGGAQPRIRHRDRRLIHSRKPYMPNLPQNFYDPNWLSTLTSYTKEHEVQPQDTILPLPRMVAPEAVQNDLVL